MIFTYLGPNRDRSLNSKILFHPLRSINQLGHSCQFDEHTRDDPVGLGQKDSVPSLPLDAFDEAFLEGTFVDELVEPVDDDQDRLFVLLKTIAQLDQ